MVKSCQSSYFSYFGYPKPKEKMLENLSKYNVLLASKSPRRRELLQQLRIPFNVITIGGVDESFPADIPPLDAAQYVSRKKAEAYREKINGNEMIITADTMVVVDDLIFGKPKDSAQATEMLKTLSGRTHQVVTGVTISTLERMRAFSVVTDVTFAPIDDDDIRYYIENFQPFDKAGAYGIQEWIGCIAVSSINGSYYNVMGLPVHRLYHELRKF